jgi:hypothetical protein
MPLNIAGPEYDFGQVLFAVIQECEHRRRGIDVSEVGRSIRKIASEKLAEIKAAYDEFGGAPAYWKSLEKEVLHTALPQYIQEAATMNELELNGFGVFRKGDPAARLAYALAGLLIGSIIIALPFIPIVEDMFAFALTGGGLIYPDLVRYTYERRHARFLNGLVTAAGQYQSSADLHYMTTKDIRESFTIGSLESGEPVSSPAHQANDTNAHAE